MKHVVRKGECLSSIARKHGLASWKDIYDLPANAEIRGKRPNPNLIYPGDVFEIPERKPKSAGAPTGGLGSFKVDVGKAELRLRLLDLQGAELTGAAYQLALPVGPPVKGRLGAHGDLVNPIPADARRARLEVTLASPPAAAKPPADGLDLPKEAFTVPEEALDTAPEDAPPSVLEVDLEIGALRPVADPQGARARLHNLGYLPDVAGPAPALAAACRAFQHDQKLPTTGLLDAATLPALERAHDGGLP